MKKIQIIGAQQNNLKSLNLDIPLGSFTVVCGPSGSGKSSLAFETLFAEGQRNYTQTLSTYARQYIQQLPKPFVKSIHNIPPALALEQKNSVRSSRPTVATLTQLFYFLRLLFTHLGQAICPEHKIVLSAYSPYKGAKKIKKIGGDKKGIISFLINPMTIGLSHAALKKKLLKEGFRRVWWKDARRPNRFPLIRELNSSFKTFPKKEIYIVLDRVVFTDQERITDSLKAAYKFFLIYNKKELSGKAVVISTDNHIFNLSEKPSCIHCAYEFNFPFQVSFFNFNSSLGACPSCRGFGHDLIIDEKKVIPQGTKSIAEGAIVPFMIPSASIELRSLKQFCHSQKIDLHCPWEQLPALHKKKIWKGSSQFIGIDGFFKYLENQKYKMYVRIFLSRYKSSSPCLECLGTRFRKEVNHVLFKKKTLPELLSMDIKSLREFFKTLSLVKKDQKKSENIIKNIIFILDKLYDIGLGYLTLDRMVKSLSSGEFQRLNLVHQLGLGLSQVLYVLDEPTVGLHSRDSQKLIELLNKLKQLGNTLVVVEHDIDVIKQASFIVELGPQSGFKGGEIIFSGNKKDFLKCTSSLTRSYFIKQKKKPFVSLPVDFKNYKYFLEIMGCNAHNLKNVHLRVPLNRLVTVTGVSGSGKSTLIGKTLYPALAKALGQKVCRGQPYKKLIGAQYLKQVIWMDSTSVDKTRRTIPVTYLKIYDQIRNLMASYCNSTLKFLDIKPSVFSLNVEGGRCSNCRGLGYQEIEMVFMDSLCIPCEECKGERFNKDILNLKWRDKNINQILNMTVSEALEFFVSFPGIWKPLSLLKKVGLDYIALGKSLSTLSGGESQRLKLARELLLSHSKNTLYILDEPTVGLHFREVELLLKVLRDLITEGGSVLLIEHNLELISKSDYIIDIGPEAGPQGGKIIVQGSPLKVSSSLIGHTAHFLKNNY